MTLQASEHNIALPAIDPAADAAPWLAPQGYLFTPGACPPSPTEPGWVSTCFHWTVRLATIQDAIMKMCYGLRPTRPGLAEWSGLCDELDEWGQKLPEVLSMANFGRSTPPPHVVTLQITHQKAILLLHRPFFDHQTGGARLSAERCEDAAENMLKLLEVSVALLDRDVLRAYCY
jgi:hypothetical protein